MRMKKAHDKATTSMGRVNKAYDNSLSRLKKEIKLLTKDFDGMKPEEIRKFLNGHISYDRYNEWLQIYKTTKDKAVKKEMEKLIKANATGFRIRRKEAMLRDIEMERLAMTGSQLDNFGSHLRNVYKSTLNETGFKGVNKNLIDEAMNHNWAGSNYSKRVWHNNKVLAKRIETNLFESFISGKSNKQIVDELEYLTDLGRHAANRLVRTETSYMVNSADLESSKQRGIKAKKFEATLDSRTSKVCRRHNQKIIPIDKIKIGENAPPLHPYCRSFLADVLEGWDYETEEELKRLMKSNENIENKPNILYNNIEIDKFTPCLLRVSDNKVIDTTFKKLGNFGNIQGWRFDWNRTPKDYTTYALYAEGDERIQGLINMKKQKDALAIHINIVESAPHNTGFKNNTKEYEGVGGHLFAEAVKQSFENGYDGFVFFEAKTELFEYYSKELGAVRIGNSNRMYIGNEASIKLFNKYYGEKNAR